ncbi:ComK family protein [Anoxybacillus flavithermus NBRC 109594]|uniref:ComK family protein n=2 Tax=Anoxybacillus TaxID=150247 RepID=R4FZK2_9BACL|nr:ComK family protein [Anoxybacillus flavithermus NBRC 109594]
MKIPYIYSIILSKCVYKGGSGMLIVEHLYLTRYTMGLFPFFHDKQMWTKVLEEDGEIIVKQKPMEIIEQSCLYYGASLRGRKDGARHIIGTSHKAPIAVEPTNEIFFFPTISPMNPQCVWLSHLHIRHHEHVQGGKTRITFSNGTIVELCISHHSFINQLHRTAQLRTKMNERIEARERKMMYLLYLREKEWS